MLKNVPISVSGLVMNIKSAWKLCHFDILSNIGVATITYLEAWAGNIFYITNYRYLMIFINY